MHNYACFFIHHFFGSKIFKYLIAHEIVALRGWKMTDKWPKIPWQLWIWIFIIPRSDLFKKDPHTGGVESQNVRKSLFLSTFSTALRCIIVIENLKTGGDSKYTYASFSNTSLLVGSMVKYLISRDVLMGCFNFCQEEQPNCRGSNLGRVTLVLGRETLTLSRVCNPNHTQIKHNLSTS